MSSVTYYASAGTEVPKLTLSPMDIKNTLFNFPSDFFPELQALTTNELARSVPYISVKTLNRQGEILEDLNLNFFFKTADLANMKNGARFGDRPIMSIKSLELKTSLATGYLYYTDVNLLIKIHSPAVLTQGTITSLVFPGMPHLLEYGWNSPNEYLNSHRAQLLFQVVTYDLKFSETGEIELLVKGKAFNDTFNNTYVGDVGQEIDTKSISNIEVGGLSALKEKVDAYVKYFEDAMQDGNQKPNDMKLAKIMATNYKNVEKKVRGEIAKEFASSLDRLSSLAVKGEVQLHQLIHTLCDKTFGAMMDAWPRVDEFQFVYGNINETIRGTKIPNSLAKFPINLHKFNALLKEARGDGQTIMTVQCLLNLIARRFIENDTLWTDEMAAKDKKNAAKQDADYYNIPEIVINFTNERGPNNNGVMRVTFHDVKQGIPVTTTNWPDAKASQAEIRSAVVAQSGLPILQLGHANSFVKSAALSQITNSALQAVLLERMAKNRVTTVRDSKPQSTDLRDVNTTPLTLPLRGNLSVIGHPEWKIFRSLYLEAGIFLVDGVYKIMEVAQKLSADGYTTDLVLMYN